MMSLKSANWLYSLSLVSSALFAANVSQTITPSSVSQSDFGGVGLLQMPTARMSDVGEFSANYRDNDQYRRWSVSVQPFEWLETTLRYTDTRTRLYSGDSDFSGNQSQKDKGIDMKARLWQESRWLPQVSVGVRDFTGTGLFDSEYLAASKRVGPFDFTMGMGWGNMAESGNITNPFCKMSDTWCYRSSDFSGRGGKFEVNKMLHGPAALFGGIEYQTPWEPLRFKLEYDSNDYSHEFAGVIPQDSPFNVGAVYRVSEPLEMHLSYERGNTFMWGFTLRTNFNQWRPIHYADPAPEPVSVEGKDKANKTEWSSVAQKLESNAGYQHVSIKQQSDTLVMTGEQQKYRDSQQATDRAAAILVNQADPSVTSLHIQQESQNMPVKAQDIDLAAFRKAKAGAILGEQPPVYAQDVRPALSSVDTLYQAPASPLDFSLSPSLTQSIGGPESFYMYQLGVNANTNWHWNEHFSTDSTVYVNAVDNYDRFNFTAPPADSGAIPRVRTHIREYASSSNVLLNNLQLTEMRTLAPDWYAQAYTGYLEMMYAGAGSEVLYRPFARNWALGLDANYVRQRDWDNTLKLEDYSTATGHLTAYWHLPLDSDVLAKVSVGRYLAKDYGTTIDLSRRFDSGVIVGAFATVTNVSATAYGEGSFTKGVYVSIPLDLMLAKPTVRSSTISWIPLTRDGGQMLNRRYHLYDVTDTE
ncbi:YjbH domain-containing protein [uncultured Tolumonas sp.]|uniref:YjbH domain-containing protein n=1 Tax=uncultured Tolumonas sp. TaxID=263765 RepID=UPI002A0A59CB|nr:YjbH domain-containing protein [uncultured Tolumonas sp.]